MQRTAAISAWIVGFFLAIWLLGFSITVPAMTLLYLRFYARERWTMTIVLTLAAWGFFYGLFEYLLHVPFPDGKIFLWLEG